VATKETVKKLLSLNMILKHINLLPEDMQQKLFEICASRIKQRKSDWLQAEDAIERIFKTPMASWTKETMLMSIRTYINKKLKLLRGK